MTSLHKAAGRGNSVEVKQCLVDGSDINSHEIATGLTPLHVAAMRGHYDVVVLLLDRGARVNEVDLHGASVLHAATTFGQARIVQLLLSRGANKNLTDKNGFTPLDQALQIDNREIIDILLIRHKSKG